MEEETVQHFLLRCPLHSAAREILRDGISLLYNDSLTEEILLGEGGMIDIKNRTEIARLVYGFVCATSREI